MTAQWTAPGGAHLAEGGAKEKAERLGVKALPSLTGRRLVKVARSFCSANSWTMRAGHVSIEKSP